MYVMSSAPKTRIPRRIYICRVKRLKIRDKFALPRLALGRRHGASAARQGAGQRRGANAAQFILLAQNAKNAPWRALGQRHGSAMALARRRAQ